jgi:hypothetical protein
MVLAHGSGIDDLLMFVVPVALALGALRLAERRAAKHNREAAPEQPTDNARDA